MSELHKNANSADAMVCYCYRLTTNKLREEYMRLGSLAEVERCTRAGTACMGCKIILRSLFNEEPSGTVDQQAIAPTAGTACIKPGQTIMKGFIVADGSLESRVFSSNGVAPQLGICDASTPISWALLNHAGNPILTGEEILETNGTFVFDTRQYDFPRPFVGMFWLGFGRGNYGGSRFNVQWSNGRSVTSTHEVGSSGRPRVILPVIVDKAFLAGPSQIYLGLCNPHDHQLNFSIVIFSVEDGREFSFRGTLGPRQSYLVDANQNLYSIAMGQLGEGRYAVRIDAEDLNPQAAVTIYFFIHHKELDSWTANHL